jgi:hypothetical protein
MILLPEVSNSELKKKRGRVLDSAGVTSATMEGDKIIVVGEGVDPIALTTMLRRSLGYAELLSVSSGEDKKKGDGYGYGGGMSYGGGGVDGYGAGAKEGKGSGGKDKSKDKGQGYGDYGGVPPPVPYPAYNQYNAVPSYPPVYSYPAYAQQEQDPGCSIM